MKYMPCIKQAKHHLLVFVSIGDAACHKRQGWIQPVR